MDGKLGQTFVIDYNYFYKGAICGRLKIEERLFEDQYPVYCLINDYGETMVASNEFGAICKYTIDLVCGKYA